MDPTVDVAIWGFLGVLATGFMSVLIAHINRGNGKSPSPTKTASLSMAMIDNRAVEALAGSIETLNVTLSHQLELTKDLIQETRELRQEVRLQALVRLNRSPNPHVVAEEKSHVKQDQDPAPKG